MIGSVIKNLDNSLSTQDLNLINQYTRRNLSADEVYTFRVVLCDNDIDRDFECFSIEALNQLSELFVGKSNVFDHNPKAENQTARIYECFVEHIKGSLTKNSQPYFRLVAKAYMPKSDKNNDFILSLDSGIQKEVSVGCSVNQSICSICNQDVKSGNCSHIKGKSYNDVLCYNTLSNITDAYEWSFVAIPSQRNAGVIKSFTNILEVVNVNDILKALSTKNKITLSSVEVDKLFSYITDLQKDASYGASYKSDLKNSVVNLAVLNNFGITKNTMLSLADKMDIEELKSFKLAFEDNLPSFLSDNPQLSSFDSIDNNIEFSRYKL